MVKRSIGIDITPSCLCVAQIVHTAGQFNIEKVVKIPTRRNDDSPSEILRTLFKQHGFDRHASIAVSMSSEAVFFRNIETDSAGFEQIRQFDTSILEHNFPIKPDEIM